MTGSLARSSSVAASFAPLAVEGQVAMCAPVVFELGYSAETWTTTGHSRVGLLPFRLSPIRTLTAAALEVQAALGGRGQHRVVSLVDALVAAVAEPRDLVVLHYDVEVTGQAHTWLVSRGTTD